MTARTLRTVAARMLTRLRSLPWLWDALVRFGMSTGITLENGRLLECISRPWWLYRAGGRVPVCEVHRSTPEPVTDQDVSLCERLIAAFVAVVDDQERAPRPRGIWGWIADKHQRQLGEMLERKDAFQLARLLASMFQREFIWGLIGDASLRHHENRLGLRIFSLKSLDMLVSLAEATGVACLENPVQGQAGAAFDAGLAGLLSRLDEAVGLRIDFPKVGAPCGLLIAERLITLDTPEQLYAAMRLDQARLEHLASRPESAIRVVEIGGGYGGMCYWYVRLHPAVARYTIVDLPVVNVLQGYFLAQALGAEKISFVGEQPALVRIVPDSLLNDVDTPFDILVNKDSMPEMPSDTVATYLAWGGVSCDGLFYSYNQEARAGFPPGGDAQGVVPHAVARAGAFRRMRRDHSWLRRGYAEEVYLPVR